MGDPQYGHLTDRELLLVIATKQDGHTTRLNQINGRLDRAEDKIHTLESRDIAEQAVQQDRKRWAALAIGTAKHWKEGFLLAGVVWTAARTLMGLPVTPQ